MTAVLMQTFCNAVIHCRKIETVYSLTHLSLASLLWDVGKQHSPRCDAAERGVPSGAILFAQRNFIEKWNTILKSHLRPLKIGSGLSQLIMVGESIRQIWINHACQTLVCLTDGQIWNSAALGAESMQC